MPDRMAQEKAKELGYEIAWKKLQSLLERLIKLKRDYINAISMLEEGRIEDLALFLMTEYYDKAYKLSKRAFFKAIQLQ